MNTLTCPNCGCTITDGGVGALDPHGLVVYVCDSQCRIELEDDDE